MWSNLYSWSQSDCGCHGNGSKRCHLCIKEYIPSTSKLESQYLINYFVICYSIEKTTICLPSITESAVCG